ncbi:MAG: type II toxin-antitoxin system RelE/ParE family toxin [Phycisphaerales bacterium]|jgi:plasmid stabilization system protein ParE
MNVWFHPEARIELLESIAYYGSHEPSLGVRFLDGITEAIRRIERHPNSYPRVPDTWRQCRIPRFPYGLVYVVTPDRIEIIAVVHLRRRPGYWRDRVDKPSDK